MRSFLDCLTLEDGDGCMSRNVGNHLPIYAAWSAGTAKISITPWRKTEVTTLMKMQIFWDMTLFWPVNGNLTLCHMSLWKVGSATGVCVCESEGYRDARFVAGQYWSLNSSFNVILRIRRKVTSCLFDTRVCNIHTTISLSIAISIDWIRTG
jgi:hypothetical protein